MNELLINYLNKRSEELMVYKMPKNESLMSEIFKFDPMNLEAVPSADLHDPLPPYTTSPASPPTGPVRRSEGLSSYKVWR